VAWSGYGDLRHVPTGGDRTVSQIRHEFCFFFVSFLLAALLLLVFCTRRGQVAQPMSSRDATINQQLKHTQRVVFQLARHTAAIQPLQTPAASPIHYVHHTTQRQRRLMHLRTTSGQLDDNGSANNVSTPASQDQRDDNDNNDNDGLAANERRNEGTKGRREEGRKEGRN